MSINQIKYILHYTPGIPGTPAWRECKNLDDVLGHLSICPDWPNTKYELYQASEVRLKVSLQIVPVTPITRDAQPSNRGGGDLSGVN